MSPELLYSIDFYESSFEKEKKKIPLFNGVLYQMVKVTTLITHNLQDHDYLKIFRMRFLAEYKNSFFNF